MRFWRQEMALFAGKGQQKFMAAIFAFHAGNPVARVIISLASSKTG
jgi:hypothetical protein